MLAQILLLVELALAALSLFCATEAVELFALSAAVAGWAITTNTGSQTAADFQTIFTIFPPFSSATKLVAGMEDVLHRKADTNLSHLMLPRKLHVRKNPT